MLKIGATGFDERPVLIRGTLDPRAIVELLDFTEDDPMYLEQSLSICSLITCPRTSLEHNGLIDTLAIMRYTQTRLETYCTYHVTE